MASFDHWYTALERGGGPVYEHLTAMAHELDQPLGQQGFSTTTDLLALGRAMGLAAGQSVLDVCCGLGGPAACIAEQLGCVVLGLDTALAGLRIAARRHGRARYVVGDARHLPFGSAAFDAALVLDSLASFGDKGALLRELRRVIAPGGRLGCTVEAGEPFGLSEEAAMAAGATGADIRPIAAFLQLLERSGFRPLQVDDRTDSQARVARELADGWAGNRAALASELGAQAVDDLVATLRTWADLLGRRRLSMLAVVAERQR